jgi:outer membrane protein assembly factor BamB
VATKFARAYDPNTGRELWRLGKHSTFVTPTPVAADGVVYFTSGSGGTVQPIYAVRLDARGDVTLKEDEVSNEAVLWSWTRGGSFIPTPVVYDGILYVSSTTGILSAYDVLTGKRLYQDRLTRGGSYSASGVAADGKLYFASEDGDVIVVKAGPKFERLAQNPMGEVMMATPAITQGMMIVRTQHHVVSVVDSQGAGRLP